jgi:hypothetical protein
MCRIHSCVLSACRMALLAVLAPAFFTPPAGASDLELILKAAAEARRRSIAFSEEQLVWYQAALKAPAKGAVKRRGDPSLPPAMTPGMIPGWRPGWEEIPPGLTPPAQKVWLQSRIKTLEKHIEKLKSSRDAEFVRPVLEAPIDLRHLADGEMGMVAGWNPPCWVVEVLGRDEILVEIGKITDARVQAVCFKGVLDAHTLRVPGIWSPQELGPVIVEGSRKIRGLTVPVIRPLQVEPPTADGDRRSRWLNQSYDQTIQREKGGEWIELDNKTRSTTARLKETDRTGDYVELSGFNFGTGRIYANRMEMKRGDRWEWVSNGHWIEEGK